MLDDFSELAVRFWEFFKAEVNLAIIELIFGRGVIGRVIFVGTVGRGGGQHVGEMP